MHYCTPFAGTHISVTAEHLITRKQMTVKSVCCGAGCVPQVLSGLNCPIRECDLGALALAWTIGITIILMIDLIRKDCHAISNNRLVKWLNNRANRDHGSIFKKFTRRIKRTLWCFKSCSVTMAIHTGMTVWGNKISQGRMLQVYQRNVKCSTHSTLWMSKNCSKGRYECFLLKAPLAAVCHGSQLFK